MGLPDAFLNQVKTMYDVKLSRDLGLYCQEAEGDYLDVSEMASYLAETFPDSFNALDCLYLTVLEAARVVAPTEMTFLRAYGYHIGRLLRVYANPHRLIEIFDRPISELQKLVAKGSDEKLNDGTYVWEIIGT